MGTSVDNTKPYDGGRYASNGGAPVGSSDDLSCKYVCVCVCVACEKNDNTHKHRLYVIKSH
jgi:hypothetical protein